MAERREYVIAEVANSMGGSQPRKLSFDNGGDFIRQTRREVDEYLSVPRIRTRGRLELYGKGVVAFALMLGSWATLVFGHPGLWLGLIAFGGLIIGTSLLAFCVMHDANHGAYFGTRRWNHLMGWTADALLGLSSYAWRVKHNVAHHTYTNVDGYDADITQMPFARLMPVQPPRPWYRLQHYYIWALYCVMGLRWQTVGDVAAFARGSIGTSALRFPRRWDLVGLIGGKAIFAICPRNRVLTWLVGGLNYQIEHHLFPRVPHTHYPRIAEIVQRTAELHGVRYVAQRSLRAALQSHFRHLRTMGRMGIPIAPEMG
jgi:fatty acid desaturase